MRCIIAGSQTITNYQDLLMAIYLSQFKDAITEVVSGTAQGIDKLGEKWARDNHLPIKPFPADWDKYGKSAGPIRNSEMAKYADALIAVWDCKSKGTLDMIKKAKANGLKVYIHEVT